MKKQDLIHKTIHELKHLPKEKANEIADFADYILKKYEDEVLQGGIKVLTNSSKSFKFLDNEEDLYSEKDLILK